MAVQVNLLGGFSSKEAGGRPLVFSTVKSEALLAYLLLEGMQPQYRDKLATLLWGSSPETQARASLRQALSRVRKVWPAEEPSCLIAEGTKVTVDLRAVDVDVAVFEDCAAAGTPESLQRAADLYRGALLDGMTVDEAEFDDWLRQERARLQETALTVHHRLLEHYAATGAIERGIAVANRLLALDPYQEGVRRTLMRFYLYQERRGAALAEYQRCRLILDRDLGLEPEAETLELYRQLLKGEAEPGPDRQAQAMPATLIQGSEPSEGLARRPARAQRPTPSPSIAVLPFQSLTDGADETYVCEGIAADIITELTRFRELHVIARNSSFSYRASQAAPQRIGRELAVQYLLDGSLRRQGDRIRLSVQLVEAESGHEVWAERYDEPFGDLFAVQDEVVRRIVTTLVGRIAAERLSLARRKPPETWQAYDHWLQGMAHLRRVDMSSLNLARTAFQRAAETDPAYARAFAGIAMTHFRAWSCYNWNAWAMLEDQAADYAHKAVSLDENDHHAHGILSGSCVFKREYERARLHIERAVELNPNDASTLANATVVWSYYGDAPKAVQSAETAIRLDPHHPDWYLALLGMAHFVGRNYAAAISAVAGEPDALCDSRAYLAAANALAGNPDEAERHGAEFLRVCREHLGGDTASDAGRYMAWLMRANPYRRKEDTKHFRAGLRKAGLPA